MVRKVQRGNLRDRLAFVGRDERFGTGDGVLAVRSGAAAMSPVAQIVVDAAGSLVDANLSARALLAIGDEDLGRPFHDLPVSYRPVDLRGAIDKAYLEGAPVNVGRVDWPSRDGADSVVEVEVSPVSGPGDARLGATIIFTDVTALSRVQTDYQRSRNELETAYEELQSTVEELETTNEELQSTNEELETTNEELQSTNEELETMNEELQSTNEELETTNTELRMRSDELNTANAFLASILTGLEVAVVVVDPKLQVLAWNHRAEDLWGLRANEVQGRHFMNLDIGLPVGQLLQPVRSVLTGETERAEVTLECRNRRGKSIRCPIRCTPLAGATGEMLGAILLMEEVPMS
jgi:two-component system CheB/CheR fusion protein